MLEIVDCDMCGGIGSYIVLPGDVIADCPYCRGSGKILPDDIIPYFPTEDVVQ